MALVGPPLPWVRRDNRRGIFYTRQWRGKTVVCNWPRHRKARRSALQRQREYDFANVALAIKWMDPAMQSAAIDTFKGSQILWRDFLTSMLYGTAFALTGEEGQTIYPRQFRDKVSNALDLLGMETGALLVRSGAMWQTIRPGAAGTTFTSAGPDALPFWA